MAERTCKAPPAPVGTFLLLTGRRAPLHLGRELGRSHPPSPSKGAGSARYEPDPRAAHLTIANHGWSGGFGNHRTGDHESPVRTGARRPPQADDRASQVTVTHGGRPFTSLSAQHTMGWRTRPRSARRTHPRTRRVPVELGGSDRRVFAFFEDRGKPGRAPKQPECGPSGGNRRSPSLTSSDRSYELHSWTTRGSTAGRSLRRRTTRTCFANPWNAP